MMPEDQRKMRDMEARLARYEKAEADARKRQQEEQKINATQQAQQQLGKAFRQALTAAGVEVTPQTIARMSYLAEAELAQGIPFDPRELAMMVADETNSYAGTKLKKLAANPAELAAALGEQGVREFNNYLMAQVKAKQPTVAQVTPIRRERSAPQEKGKTRLEDYYASKNKK
ncbi:Hypothetical protein I5071_9570 [Sandaracinus amylolyticus]|nr:Hypothetical protein I5071_9570 [Sandaracinus amylolyticus]